LLEDDRFKSLFEDTDFKIDKNSEHYKLHKPTEKAHEVESDQDELPDEKAAVNFRSLNNLFADRDDSSENSEKEDKTFKKKIQKKQQDKITKIKP
jgi:hypothetical protein